MSRFFSKLPLISFYIISSGLIISCGGSSSDNQQTLPSFVSLIQNQPVEPDGAQTLKQLFQMQGQDFQSFSDATYNIGNPGDAPLELTNQLLCFANQLYPQNHLGEAAYQGLVDLTRCYSQGSFTGYQLVTIQAYQQGMLTRINLWWHDQTSNLEHRARFSISQPATAVNPYGNFELFHHSSSDFANADIVKTWLNVGVVEDNNDNYAISWLKHDSSQPAQSQLEKALYIANKDGATGQYHLLADAEEQTVFNSDYIFSQRDGVQRCYDLSQMRCDVMGYALFYNQDAPDSSYSEGQMVQQPVGKQFTYTQGQQSWPVWLDAMGIWSEASFTDGSDYTLSDAEQLQYTLTPSNNSEQFTLLKNLPGGGTESVNLGAPLEFSYTYNAGDMGDSAGSVTGTHSLSYSGIGSMIFTDSGSNTLNFNNGLVLSANSIQYKLKRASIIQNSVQLTSNLPADCTVQELPDFTSSLSNLEFTQQINDQFIQDAAPTVSGAIRYVAGQASQ